MVKSLGFSNFEVVDPIGFSGGLWLLWNANKVKVEIIGTSDQTISAYVSWSGRSPWIFTGIYANPCSTKRAKLWEYLNFVANCHQMPWLIAGDFNDMLKTDEKMGGTPLHRLRGFKKWFDENNMIDLGFSGPKFTWTNNRVFERIDRAVCNLQWRQQFAEAFVQHLPRTKSDHCPIKICLKSRVVSCPNRRPFRFEAMWLKHDQFHDFISQRWDQGSGSALAKSRSLVEPLKHWNLVVFGHLKQRKARLLARLIGIQRVLCHRPNRFLTHLEESLSNEYNIILDQEALFWQQKSRVKWLQEGDRNTKFFHISTIVRRRRNKIEKLMNNVGVWVEEAIELKDLAVDYFMGLFCANQPDNANLPMPKLFPSLREDELNPLVASIDINEVKESLFNIGSLKTPGVDGFPACFYQNQWQLCGNDIFNLVTEAFKECRIPEGLNATLVTLIPKIDNPMSMIHFRPISLCCTLYKVISKVIVARLRPLLAKLVSPHQVSFIPGRHLSDNILIAQELMFKFRNTKRKKGFIAWKIDLSKAYDRLNWGFIMTVLKEVGFPENLIQLIIHCVSSVTYQVCVNGELTETFTPKNGIRQGDPLSPYLFVLCMEKFSHLIVEAVKNFNWKPVKSSQGGPFVSHLFFADDLILFAEATPRQAHIMKQCLDEFCRASGQVVNFEKSAIYCSPNISKELASDISHICGSPLTNNLGKYLGMPLLHSRVTKSTYNNLVDKVHARLASWKSRVLSSAGRATLIQAVTSAIPVFAMQTAKLPMSICDELDKLNRNFFWGGSDKKTKVHLCQWDLLCRPKSKGGLGFKKTHEMNKALLAKSGWRLLKKDEGLWAQIFEKKYLRGHSPCDPNLLLKQNCSPTWKGIVFGSQLLEKGLIWRLGKGDNINFWKDKWIADEALIHMVEVSPDSSMDTIVSDFLMDGWWDIEKLRRVLPEDWVQKIIGCPADLGGTTEDCQIWQTTSNGLFSVKTAYNLLFSGTEWLNPWWKVLWKLKLPPKILFFFWLAYQGKIMSNEQRARRLFIGDPACCICDWHSESTLHILRDCTRAKRVWNLFLNSNQYAPFFHAELHPWLLSNFCSKNMFLQIPWKTLFGVICWHLWKWRNDFIFNNKDDLPFNPRELILSATKEWIKASTNNQLGGDKIQVSLAWTPPENGVLKLNVDGSLMKSSGSIGAGGVIRDHLGNWIGGFAVNLGKGQILEAELWGLFFGLKLAITRGIMDIIVEMDSVNAVNLILSNDLNICHPMAGLVSSCKRLLRQIPKCFLHHIYREKNAVADRLAAWSHDIDLGCWFLEDNPTWLGPLLLDDSIGVTKTRIISSV
ncbi:uncharacterized protein LOC117624139 [Prunus dulcis]|uniref:uncharacterized protein LOC117624139 n=1 Tax=Prunus dulcis TaxID=3755 RepID=UPI0014823723|nr:uncharacterized protein LOC117624139 [Prunus dulcis]